MQFETLLKKLDDSGETYHVDSVAMAYDAMSQFVDSVRDQIRSKDSIIKALKYKNNELERRIEWDARLDGEQ